jgi:hypothetical protein
MHDHVTSRVILDYVHKSKQENVLTQASNSAAKCSIHQRFLDIHHMYFKNRTKDEDFFGKFISILKHAFFP